MIDAKTTHGIYERALRHLLFKWDYDIKPRGLDCFEIRSFHARVHNPTYEPIVTKNVKRNEIIRRYTEREFELYEKCENSAEAFAQASKFWAQIANEDGTVNSAYGKIIWHDRSVNDGTPWEWAKGQLQSDRDTRQATLLFMRPDHLRPCKDIICTSHGQFMIRAKRLHLSIVMRSNDVVKGFVYDLPWFCYILHRMSKEIDVPVGSYDHFVHSFHLYAKDVDIARSMI